jgi:cytochrome P450
MKFVWSESLDQTRQMISSWETNGITSFAKDARTLSLNVLAATGFRRSFEFQPANSEAQNTGGENAESSYRDALSTVLDNAILLMLIPYRYLLLPVFPKPLQRIGQAGLDFKGHMKRMLEEETAALNSGETGVGSLMTSFVKAQDRPGSNREASKMLKGLSVDEVYGNIFVINFAGHDTTANTLAFSMALLATEPNVQDWVAAEVRNLVTEDDSSLDYSHVYPQLLRCRAVLVSPIFT